MTAQAQDTGTAAGRRHRSDAGMLRLTQRDIDGLVLCGEHYGAPFDLLGAALGVSRVALPQVVKRWRNFGYAANGRLGPGPAWCWLTREGMTAAGLRYSPVRPALSRIAHIRAVLAARLWLSDGPAWRAGRAWWRSERRLATGRRPGSTGHLPDAEIHWPSIDGSRYAGQIWAVEVELSPKPVARTTEIMTELLSTSRYTTVVYLTAPAARSVVRRAVALLPAGDQPIIAARDLPASAFTPERPR
jgi:hypothetical protein